MSKKKYLFSNVELQRKIDSLPLLYLPIDLNYSLRRNKIEAIKQLEHILSHTERRCLQYSEYSHVLVCALTVVYFFGMKLLFSSKHVHYFDKHDFKRAEACFQKAVDLLLPERFEMSITITFKFFDDVSLWQFESFCAQILEILLFFGRGEMQLFNCMLTDIHYVIFWDVPAARHRMRILYELLGSDYWVIDKHKLFPLITRLLDFYAKNYAVYTYLRKGFEVCLKRIFEKVQNHHRLSIIATMLNWFNMVKLAEDDVLTFLVLVDRVAELYVVDTYSDSLYDGLIIHVLKNLVCSSDHNHSLVGVRLLQRFLDRQGNLIYLSTPTIFYEFSQANLKIGSFESGDKSFIRHHRETIHSSVLKAFTSHSENSVNIKALYIVICCLVLEVPCGMTAAAVACLLMSVQDIALNEESLSPISRYWMHAIVVSVMSLICWVHKSKVLYNYVITIISRRAQEAPHLNPPIKQVYNLGYNHLNWDKPTLFFEDWELRYGLWKHFSEKTDKDYGLIRDKYQRFPRLRLDN